MSPAMANDRLTDPHAQESERLYATCIHLTLLAYPIMPFVIVLAPLVMWLVRRNDSPFIDDHGRETVNFHLSLVLYALAIGPVALVTCGLGAVLWLAVYALGLVGMVLAAVAAHRGEYFRYPATLRLL